MPTRYLSHTSYFGTSPLSPRYLPYLSLLHLLHVSSYVCLGRYARTNAYVLNTDNLPSVTYLVSPARTP